MKKRLQRNLLRLKMKEAALEASGTKIPFLLSVTVNALSSSLGQPGVITYEEIILENRGDDRLTFSSDAEIRKSEIIFYDGNYNVEKSLETILEAVFPIALKGSLQASQKASKVIKEETYKIKCSMKELFSLNREHFDSFRKFLTGNKKRGLKGPSGAFTAKVPILELLTFGEKSDANYVKYIKDNIIYFPNCDKQNLTEVLLLAEGKHLDSKFEALCDISGTEELVQSIKDLLVVFRKQHLGLVQKKLPDETKGTAGETFLPFLKDRIDKTIQY